MLRRSLDLLACVLLVADALLVQLAGLDTLAILVALPLVLVAPGYCLVAALFPNGAIGGVERVLLTLGLSLLTSVLGALLLDLTPWGLTRGSWTVLLGGVVLVAAGIAVRRRARLPVRAPEPAAPRVRLADLLLFGLALVAVTGALTFARASVEERPRPGFTQLWITPLDADAAAFQTFEIGVYNEEGQAEQYMLRVFADGEIVDERPLALANEATARVPLGLAGRDVQTLVVALYRGDDLGTPYRRVSLTRPGAG